METGKRNCLVVIQSRAAGQDDNGQPNGAWSTFASLWANIRYGHGTGAEAIRAGAEMSTTRVSVRINYRTDITSAMQVVYQGATYHILAVMPDMAKRDHTDLVCELIV